jgi:hypothetical protein
LPAKSDGRIDVAQGGGVDRLRGASPRAQCAGGNQSNKRAFSHGDFLSLKGSRQIRWPALLGTGGIHPILDLATGIPRPRVAWLAGRDIVGFLLVSEQGPDPIGSAVTDRARRTDAVGRRYGRIRPDLPDLFTLILERPSHVSLLLGAESELSREQPDALIQP